MSDEMSESRDESDCFDVCLPVSPFPQGLVRLVSGRHLCLLCIAASSDVRIWGVAWGVYAARRLSLACYFGRRFHD